MTEDGRRKNGGRRPGSGKPIGGGTPRALPEAAIDDQARLIKAKADREEENAAIAKLDRAQREGELLDAAEVEAQIVEMVTRVRAKFLAIPTKVAAAVLAASDVAEVEALIKAEIYQGLREFGR